MGSFVNKVLTLGGLLGNDPVQAVQKTIDPLGVGPAVVGMFGPQPAAQLPDMSGMYTAINNATAQQQQQQQQYMALQLQLAQQQAAYLAEQQAALQAANAAAAQQAQQTAAAQAKANALTQRRLNAGSSGRSSTILTGGSGLTGPAPVGKKTLLGQ